jgi:hypothetical protein
MKRHSSSNKSWNIFPCLSLLIILFSTFFYIWTGILYVPPEIPKTVYNADTDPISIPADGLVRELENAFTLHSPRRMERFLRNWHRRFRQNETTLGAQNDTLRAVYDLFAVVFNPNLLRRPTGAQSDSPYRYAVIQQEILFYTFNDTYFDRNFTSSTSRYHTLRLPDGRYSIIENFRPQIKNPEIKSLYLSDDYRKAFDLFLGTYDFSETLNEGGSLMNRVRFSPESRERWFFLQDFLYIQAGHWGGYWLYETPPWIGFILLNKSLDKAVVELRANYSGVEILFHKTASGWEKQKVIVEWIE